MASRLRRLGGLFLIGVAMAAGLLPGGVLRASDASREPAVVRVSIQSGITQATAAYLEAAVDYAREAEAQALVIELDTPGGLLDATRQMVQAILRSPVPVVVLVSPAGARAGSAGVFLTMAAHVAAMVPASNIGAAHPVSSFGGDVEGAMGDKVVNDTAAWARTLAQTRGRNAEWAAKAVTESLSATAQEALELEVIDLIAQDSKDLLERIDGREVVVADRAWVMRTAGGRLHDFERTGKQRFYEWFANPTLMYLLLLVGMLGLYVEFQSPGLIVPGALGALCLALVFGIQALPINMLGVLLIGAAMVLFVLEAYVTSLGLLAVGGTAALVAGSYLLFDVPGSSFRLDASIIWAVALTFALLAVGLAGIILRVKLQGPTSGTQALVGQLAVVHVAIGPQTEGKVFLDGSYWNARAERAVPEGAQVRVAGFEGLTVHVEPLDEEGTFG